MNTNKLKKFAQGARTKLLEQVKARLEYVLSHDTAELRGKAEAVKNLKEELQRSSKAAVVDKVAYTWFNRLMALRFMDANEYQPLGIGIVSPASGALAINPQILDEAHAGNVPTELADVKQEVLDILDGRQQSNNPDNDAYRILLVAACNHMHAVLPFLFEKIDDYTELLLPEDLTSSYSIVREMVQGMSEEDCTDVELIGWLYQFYISEKKDEVFASKSAVKKEDIPAATQLFTPRWIVEYMVQNTLGKLWLQNKPQSRLREFMPYYIDSPAAQGAEFLRVNSVEEIRLLDQACGSGHILVYAFELFARIYAEEGYNESEIPALILKNNLFGFEIDERAAQLAGFALMMKARSMHRRIFKKEVAPNILCYRDLKLTDAEIENTFKTLGIGLTDELSHDLSLMQQATNFGSLIQPHTDAHTLQKIREQLQAKLKSADLFTQPNIQGLIDAIQQLLPLGEKYHCVVDNPPYMGGGNMNKPLGDFVKTHYPDSKADLMACFMEAGLNVLHPAGFLGMINQHSWMFLSSYEKLRGKLIEEVQFDTLLHLGPRTFPEIGGEVVQNAAFTFINETPYTKGAFLRLVDLESTELKRVKTTEAVQNPDCGWFYTANQKDFEKIPGSPIGYWLSEKMINVFNSSKILSDFVQPKQGTSTGNNEEFLRFWEEVAADSVSVFMQNKLIKWYPATKGGEYRKWFGNNEYVVNWENDGFAVTNHRSSAVRNKEANFQEALTWTGISSGNLGVRYCPPGHFFTISGKPIIGEPQKLLYSLGLLCSKVSIEALKVLSPTLSFEVGYIQNVPLIISDKSYDKIISLVEYLINICKGDWDSREISWDFQHNILINQKSKEIEEAYDVVQQLWKTKFFQLHKNEEELNSQFIEIYGLQDELTPDVPLEEITILKEETSIVNGELVFHADEVFRQFVSYAVGCMFGRYSLDKEGLILANQGETLKDYLAKVAKAEQELSFIPDEDNIIPILDDEWFEDDIVARFHAFLKASFGEAQFQKNLAFVEECLGKDIRKYFVKDFYKDHVQRYKKRPIYWLFSSPRGYFNVLVYLHRYTPDTLSMILNGYLREFMEKLNLQKKQWQHLEVSGSASEQNRARKELEKIEDMLADCRAYETDILYPLAAERISLDLDDGVLVNYNKLGKAVAEVPGLNDAKTKKKVKEFDWIDTTQIR
jgi:type II restriction/modification system DNA methylase subunit YeeA